MMVLDSSVLVAFFLKSDLHCQHVRWWFQSVPREQMIYPSLACIELACTLSRVGSSQEFIEECLFLTNKIGESIPLTEAIMISAIQIGMKCKLRGADSVFVATAYDKKAQLVTLDKEQADRSCSIIPVINLLDLRSRNNSDQP